MQEVTRTLFVSWTLHGTLTRNAMDGAEVVLLDGYRPKHAASEILYSGQRDLARCLCALMPRAGVTLFLDVDPEVVQRVRQDPANVMAAVRAVTGGMLAPPTAADEGDCEHPGSVTR